MLDSKITPCEELHRLSDYLDVELRVKRDDLYPLPGGGNKARKAYYILEYAIKHGYNALVTNGGIQSNHARAIALLCSQYGLPCKLVLHGNPLRSYSLTGNLLLMYLASAEIEVVELDDLADKMDKSIDAYRRKGLNPLYVWGGGHCLSGSLAYYDAVGEAKTQMGSWSPDYVVFASGTGTTQAGIAVGFDQTSTQVIGISVAREKMRGCDVIKQSVKELLAHLRRQGAMHIDFRDEWTFGGYEQVREAVIKTIMLAAQINNLILDPTYTGKAFAALIDLIRSGEISRGSKVLFWHTGGLLNLMASPSFVERRLEV